MSARLSRKNSYMCSCIRCHILFQKGVVQDKRYSQKHLDILSSLVLAEKALHGPGTNERRLIAHLALSTANQMRTFREDEWASLIVLLQKLDIICDIQEKVATACDCSFFYWHRVTLPTYFANLYESKMDLHRLMVRNWFFITFLHVSILPRCSKYVLWM